MQHARWRGVFNEIISGTFCDDDASGRASRRNVRNAIHENQCINVYVRTFGSPVRSWWFSKKAPNRLKICATENMWRGQIGIWSFPSPRLLHMDLHFFSCSSATSPPLQLREIIHNCHIGGYELRQGQILLLNSAASDLQTSEWICVTAQVGAGWGVVGGSVDARLVRVEICSALEECWVIW